MARKKQHPSGEPPIPEATRPAYEAIADLIDGFCREHLNEEYRVMCRKLAGTLARKRPSPLLSGRPGTWASGIARTIGWINLLDDHRNKPHMKLTAIDEAFGVAVSTGQRKLKAIRTLLKIRSSEPQWTLPSLMGEYRRAFTIEIDGSPVELTQVKRLYEMEFFRKILTGDIPAARAEDPAEE